MNIGYFADGPWSHEAIKIICAIEGVSISFIVPRYDTQDPILKQFALKLGVPFIPCENVNSSEFLNNIEKYQADLFISMSFNQILKSKIISMPRLGFINCHAGALPFYRGRNPLHWALINGECDFGITVHYVDEGIDTGDIIEQQLFSITLIDDYASLQLKADKECANVLHLAILKIQQGNVKRIKQEDIHPVGTYFGVRTWGDEIINFNWPAIKVHNFIRAITEPGPSARCYVKGKEVAILSSELIEGAPNYIATIGEVVGKSVDGVIVKVGDSTIKITLIRMLEGGTFGSKVVPHFRIGTRFMSSSQ